MRIRVPFWVVSCFTFLIGIFLVSGAAAAATPPHYLVTNDDDIFINIVSFYSVAANGSLTLKQAVATGGQGIAGGYFGSSRLALLNSSSQECVYASDANSDDIAGIDVSTLTLAGTASGSSTDSGNANGIGLAISAQYLYAGFTTSNTIATFQLQGNCSLTFVSDTPVAGLQGGFIEGMAIHGNLMVVTYGDGSIESFDITSGTPVSNGDEQNSSAYVTSQGASYPTSIEITKDGHFALFGDTSTSTLIEVSDLSSGKLRPTVAYSLGTAINSSSILLSPDETLLYISNTQGDTVTAAFFDSTTGKLSAGCTSNRLKFYSVHWSYLAQLALRDDTGTGVSLYVAEFSANPSLALLSIQSSGGQCTLAELSGSPIAETDSAGLLSIGVFPPRSF
jgi:6-phosphogluconolactonase (cycloisomerase 2 family)